MKVKELSSKNPESSLADNSLPKTDHRMERRKILGWMGVGIVGAIAFKALPFSLISKRGGKRKGARRDARVTINDMAVKRGKKVSKNV